jgi:CarD family transcriptional regulator
MWRSGMALIEFARPTELGPEAFLPCDRVAQRDCPTCRLRFNSEAASVLLKRSLAVNNDFKIGEKAVYPAHGVAEVIGIEKKEINTTVCSFYVLKVLATGMQILVPKEKADQVGLRPVATSSEIEEVFDILREKDVHIDKQTWNRRYRGFMEKIKTGSLFDVAEVYRDLYRLKSSKVLSFGERKMLDNAKQLIVKELAVAKKWAEDKVEQELEKACA